MVFALFRELRAPDPPDKQLYQRQIEARDVAEARTTKVLHKKRPQLIPIIDGQMVIGWYNARHSGPKKSGIDRMVEVTERIREDMRRNTDPLRELQKELVEAGINLTRVRLFDMVLWEAYQRPK